LQHKQHQQGRYDLLQQGPERDSEKRNGRGINKKWQKEWTECTKATITKQFFLNVQDRLKIKINVTRNFAAIDRGNGKTRAYFHRFKIMEQATCPCNDGDQTMNHFLYQ